MALMPRLREIMRRPVSASEIGAHRPTMAGRHESTAHEDTLRSMLSDDPNDEQAFAALAEVVRRRAAEAYEAEHDPLTAPGAARERERAANLAVWALGEELAGNPRAWFPLIELARLSVDDDHEGATRRLATAADRDPTGRALAAGIELLRTDGKPAEALNLGVGHWRVREQIPQVGAQLVRAALESGRPAEARQHLAALSEHPDTDAVTAILSDLETAFDRPLHEPEATPEPNPVSGPTKVVPEPDEKP
ncbi:MAG: hypothetical protein FWD18_03200 [Micrococcales bacterium]|nr:hypothetical protein [Micrococcales bacterium]